MDVEPSRRPPPGRVLVVGAGPVGLVAALLLRRHDVDVDIVDRNTEAVSQSRATDLHPATLERLDPYGVTRDLLDIGRVVRTVVVHAGGRVVGRIALGRPGSPFPFALTVPQCTTEGLLQDHLAALGGTVRRGVEVVGLADRSGGGGVDVELAPIAGATPGTHRYDWVLACDGAASTVRGCLGIGFPGRTTGYVSAIGDVELELPFANDEIHLVLRPGGGVHVLPMPVPGYVRLLLDRWPGPAGAHPDVEAFVGCAAERLDLPGLVADGARWTSSFVMHDRVADRARVGRVLLAGDAAHVCPPVGGQGLNTGIGDVVALVPALVSVMAGLADDTVLDAVAARRRVTARRTGRAAWAAATLGSPSGRLGGRVRDAVAPFGLAVGGRAVTRWLAGAFDR